MMQASISPACLSIGLEYAEEVFQSITIITSYCFRTDGVSAYQ